jgi:hypothetical protein
LIPFLYALTTSAATLAGGALPLLRLTVYAWADAGGRRVARARFEFGEALDKLAHDIRYEVLRGGTWGSLDRECKGELDVTLPPQAAAVTIEFTMERANRVKP